MRPPVRNKYGAVRTHYRSAQGFDRVYDSKREAAYAAELDLRVRAGELKAWVPQITLPLPGGVSTRIDFMLINSQGVVSFCDVKGVIRQDAANKYKQALALFGIVVEIVK